MKGYEEKIFPFPDLFFCGKPLFSYYYICIYARNECGDVEILATLVSLVYHICANVPT